MNAPDARGWVALGFFTLFVLELLLMALDAELAKTDLFKWIVQSTWQGGPMIVGAFYFISSKGSAEKDATIATMAAKTPDASK